MKKKLILKTKCRKKYCISHTFILEKYFTHGYNSPPKKYLYCISCKTLQ